MASHVFDGAVYLDAAQMLLLLLLLLDQLDVAWNSMIGLVDFHGAADTWRSMSLSQK